MKVCDVDFDEFCVMLVEYIDSEFGEFVVDDEEDVKLIVGFQCVIQCVVIYVQNVGCEEVIGVNVFVVLFVECESYVVYFFVECDMMCYDVVNFIFYGIGCKVSVVELCVVCGMEELEEKQKDGDVLIVYIVNLNEKVKVGGVDLLIGCDCEVECCVQVLCCCCKNNLLFVGDLGVGKIVIVEGIVCKIVENEVFEVLVIVMIYLFDMGLLLVGMCYCGDFEECVKQVVKELE